MTVRHSPGQRGRPEAGQLTRVTRGLGAVGAACCPLLPEHAGAVSTSVVPQGGEVALRDEVPGSRRFLPRAVTGPEPSPAAGPAGRGR